MIRNGGRNGVALSLGFRWALGKEDYNFRPDDTSKAKTSKTTIKKQTRLSKLITKMNEE